MISGVGHYKPTHDTVTVFNCLDLRPQRLLTCVSIGRYIRILWDMAVGIYIDLYLWLTVGELRLLDVLVTLWGGGGRYDGSAPGGDMRSQAVWPWFSV